MKKYIYIIILIAGIFSCSMSYAQLLSQDSLCQVKGRILLNGKPIQARISYFMNPVGDGIGFTNSDPETGEYRLNLLKNKEYVVNVVAKSALKREIIIPKDSLSLNEVHQDILLASFNKGDLLTLDILFERGKNVIEERTASDLNSLVEEMTKNNKLRIRLEGHTDFRGSRKANIALAQERVNAVKRYLLNRGVHKIQIRTKSFGGSTPITNDPKKKELNRRVEVRILDK